jgi:hypothetical protein
MPAKPRRRLNPAKERLWRGIVRRHQQSHLPVRDFCQVEGLKVGNFHWWRRELKRRDQAKTTRLPNSATKGSTESPVVPVFLPVHVVDGDRVTSRHAPPIEIVLPTGPTVRVCAGFDPRTLGDVLAVLEGRSC